MEIELRYVSLRDLLADYDWIVPEYQRVYSWQTTQQNELLNDIVASFERGESHFMATIVGCRKTTKRVREGERIDLDLVDGQQRLTTMVILLRALCARLTSESATKSYAEELELLLLPRGSSGEAVLRTNHDPKRLLAKYIVSGDSDEPKAKKRVKTRKPVEERTILDAIKNVSDFLDDLQIDVSSITQHLLDNMRFVLQIMGNQADVFRIFETLNSRGLEVSALDKVRAHLMGVVHRNSPQRIRRSNTEQMQAVWQGIYKSFDQPRLDHDETVRFAARLYSDDPGSKVPGESESIDIIKMDCEGNPSKAIEWSNRILAVARAERVLMSRPHLAGVVNVVQARFAAVAICLNYKAGTGRTETLDVWEQVVFREFGLRDKDSRSFVGDFVRFASKIVKDSVTPSEAQQILLKIGKSFKKTNSKLIDEFVSRDLYTQQPRFVKYALFQYERHLRGGVKWDDVDLVQAWPSDPEDSIEHVFPKSKTGGDGEQFDSFGKHSLGNLVLLPVGANKKLHATRPNGEGRKKKIDAYLASEMQHTQEVAGILGKLHSKDWTPGKVSPVSVRAKRIAKVLKELYPDL
jgi:hypothetical protein